MNYYSKEISNLIDSLQSLPGIGAKSAQRMAFYILHLPKEDVRALSNSLINARENVRYCKICCTLTDKDICPICDNSKRNHKQIMVVEDTRDLAAYEKIGKYEGTYHVLHGAISPMNGIGPSDIRLKELMVRLQNEEVDEVIIATNSSLEGETIAIKNVEKNVEAKNKEEASKTLTLATSLISKASNKGIYHKNNAARKISRLTRAVNSLN